MTVLPRPRPQLGMLRPCCLLRLAAWTMDDIDEYSLGE